MYFPERSSIKFKSAATIQKSGVNGEKAIKRLVRCSNVRSIASTALDSR
jgi:hypothetical protein